MTRAEVAEVLRRTFDCAVQEEISIEEQRASLRIVESPSMLEYAQQLRAERRRERKAA